MNAKVNALKIINHDIVKMLTAAVAVGLAFSVFAASVSLMLAHTSTAYAAEIKTQPPSAAWVAQHNLWVLKSDMEDVDSHADEEALTATPGNIHLSDGCGSTPIVAVERDWQVSIHGDTADIQVMQTFVIPITDNATPPIEESGYFGVILPLGATYTSFRIKTNAHHLLGKYAGTTNWDSEDTNEAASLKSRGMVRVYESRLARGVTHLSSDTIENLVQGETVIVTYRYHVPVDSIGRSEAAIRLALQDAGFADNARNSIWINWAQNATTKQPKAIINQPRQMNVEHAKNGKRIIAASIENAVLPQANVKDNGQFQLRWAM